jgi:hypothetical protein
MSGNRGALVPAAACLLAGVAAAPCFAAPLASPSRTAVAFARVAQGQASPVQPVFLTNLGDDALVVTGLALGEEGAADFRVAQSGTCGPPAALGPGERCRIDVVATPRWGETREVAATLTVESNAGTLVIALRATADAMLSAPTLASAPPFVEFPVQPVATDSAPRSLVLRNASARPLALGHPALLGGDATDFSVATDCPVESPLAPGRTCFVTLTFTPRVGGPRSTELAIEFEQGDESAFHRWSVTGSGGE